MRNRFAAFGFIALLLALSLIGPFNLNEPTPAFAQGTCDIANGVLIGTLSYGVNCLDANGFNEVEIGADFPTSSIDDVAVCPDTGEVLVLHLFGITKFDGATSTDIELPSDVFAPDALLCAAGGQLWVGHSSGVSVYDGAAWTNYPLTDFGSSSFIFSVEQLELAPDGTVWASTGSSVARFTGGAWEVFEEGAGFGEEYFLGRMTLNADGLPLVSHSNGFIGFDGSAWYESPEAPVFGLDPIAVDADGNVWLGSITEGLAVYDGSSWSQVNIDNGLSSNTVHFLTFDANGRLWVGTEYGLNILEGDVWTTYLQANSGLLDNTVRFVAPIGAPALPAAVEKAPGSVVGTIVIGRDPVPDVRVELCTELLGGTFFGDTPCADHAGALITTTDTGGNFAFEGVPAGRYDITIETPDGWIYFVGVDSEITVDEGAAVDLAFIDVAQ